MGLDKRARIFYHLFIGKKTNEMRVKWGLIWKLLPIKIKYIRGYIFLLLGRVGLFLSRR